MRKAKSKKSVNGKVRNLLSAQKAVINAVIIGSSKFVDGTMTEEAAKKNIRERLDEAKIKHGLPACMNMIPFIIQKMMDKPRITFFVEVSKGDEKRTVPVEGRVMWEVLRDYYKEMMDGKPVKEKKEPLPITAEKK